LDCYLDRPCSTTKHEKKRSGCFDFAADMDCFQKFSESDSCDDSTQCGTSASVSPILLDLYPVEEECEKLMMELDFIDKPLAPKNMKKIMAS
jgi:hypothetical protein